LICSLSSQRKYLPIKQKEIPLYKSAARAAWR
jgi:hypothetical protein